MSSMETKTTYFYGEEMSPPNLLPQIWVKIDIFEHILGTLKYFSMCYIHSSNLWIALHIWEFRMIWALFGEIKTSWHILWVVQLS